MRTLEQIENLELGFYFIFCSSAFKKQQILQFKNQDILKFKLSYKKLYDVHDKVFYFRISGRLCDILFRLDDRNKVR